MCAVVEFARIPRFLNQGNSGEFHYGTHQRTYEVVLLQTLHAGSLQRT